MFGLLRGCFPLVRLVFPLVPLRPLLRPLDFRPLLLLAPLFPRRRREAFFLRLALLRDLRFFLRRRRFLERFFLRRTRRLRLRRPRLFNRRAANLFLTRR